MTTTDSIWAAAEHLLRRDAEELRESSTSSRDRDDWTGKEEAKADYDEHIAAADALASLSTVAAQPPAGWREALEFYAQGRHFGLSDESAWDTVSGEPQNFWCDEAGTATIEDGTVAAMALRGTPLTDEETTPKAAPAATNDCTRSHPHEAMSAECQVRAVIAEMRSKEARGAEATEHELGEMADRLTQALEAHTTKAAPQPAAQQEGALTPEEADQLEKVIADFDECGETDVPYTALLRYAAMGYLECTHYHTMPSALSAIDAARSAKEGAQHGNPHD